MPKLFVGIDIGTTGTKALLLDERGRVRATATATHPTLSPKPGCSEQRPDDWWGSACRAARAVLTPGAKERVAAVGLSGQMHGSVFLDGRGRPVADALLWNDQRTVAECDEIQRRAGGCEALTALVRNVALTGYTAPKILWLRRRRPKSFARVRSIVLPKDYVRLRMTAELGTEVSDASGTLLFDVAQRRWSYALMERLELDPALFPPAVESTHVVGELTREAADALGLKPGTPVVAGAGDQAAAAVGAGVVRLGVLSATIGTSGVVFAHCDQPAPNEAGTLQSFCHAVSGKWCVFGCMLSAGGSLQWAREVLYPVELCAAATSEARDRVYATMIREAAAGDRDGREAALFHPYLTGERCPYPHPHARGGWLGLTRAATRADLVRAVLVGITLGMGRQVNLIRSLGVEPSDVRLAGGGARNAWWRQLQADVYGVRCVVLQSEQGSALGAAILAAVGSGHFTSVQAACDAMLRVKSEHRPAPRRTAYFRRLGELTTKAYEAIEPLYRCGWDR